LENPSRIWPATSRMAIVLTKNQEMLTIGLFEIQIKPS
jgi:hypothetical protein